MTTNFEIHHYYLGYPWGWWSSCNSNTRLYEQSFRIYFRLWLPKRGFWGKIPINL